MSVYEEILKGSREHPVKRETICLALNKSDRAVRREIEELRASGERICYGRATKRGYYIAKTEEEYLEFRKRYLAYALRQLYIAGKMDHSKYMDYESLEEQISMKFEGEKSDE